MRDSNHTRGLLVALVCVVVAYGLASTGVTRLPLGGPGTRDFVQYWGAWTLLRRGENPYDGVSIRALQQELGTVEADTTWNPPWTPVLLSPVLGLPFEQSAALWFLCQLLGALFLSVFIPRAVGRPEMPMVLSGLIVLSFLPVLDTLYWGQLAVLLTLGATMFLYFERKGHMFAAGVSLVPLTMKPHFLIFMLPAGVLWWWQLSPRNRWQFGLGFLGSMAMLGGVVVALAPQALTLWGAALMSPRSVMGAVPTVAWKTATVTTWFRLFLTDSVGGTPVWPMILLPSLTFVGLSWYYFYSRPTISWRYTLPVLIGLSLTTGSYGWLYDQSILVIGLVTVVADALRWKDKRARRIALSLVALIELLAVTQSCAGYNQQHLYAWIPVAVLSLLAFHRHCMRVSPRVTDPS